MKTIDQLLIGSKWKCKLIQAHGELDVADDKDASGREELELWRRNPVSCVQELIGNPAFQGEVAYADLHQKCLMPDHGQIPNV